MLCDEKIQQKLNRVMATKEYTFHNGSSCILSRLLQRKIQRSISFRAHH